MSDSHNLIKKGIVIGLVLLLILMTAVTISCGGDKPTVEEYDEQQAKVDAIVKQIESVETELKEGQAKIQSLEREIANAQKELPVAQAEAEAAQNQVRLLKGQLGGVTSNLLVRQDDLAKLEQELEQKKVELEKAKK